MTMLETDKVGAGTYGHPVLNREEKYQVRSELDFMPGFVTILYLFLSL